VIRNEYVLISLYVDDKKYLPENEQILVERSTGDGFRKLKNYGHKWAHFQTEFFQTNSQPYYVLLSPDGKEILSTPVGYTPDEADYLSFLQCGLESINSKSIKFNLN
jgi:thiol:disulfide interchange protein DsbD